MISPDELSGWVLYEDAHMIVINKLGDAVCHPSKAGPKICDLRERFRPPRGLLKYNDAATVC